VATTLVNTYSQLPECFYNRILPTPVARPSLVLFNDALANELSLEITKDKHSRADLLAGNKLIEGSMPIAQAYAGHQFGHFTMLGDGRAILLGEHQTKDKALYDIQLKGAGQTKFSRNGDGRASLSAMLREYVISEAMHYLGIKTTRSLAVVNTGEYIHRQEPQAGAVLTRIASSHIRVGTFQYARQFCTIEEQIQLLKYSVERHYPELLNADNLALALLQKCISNQMQLISEWLRVGFIHGVMNTDNMSICGETIDYGPCAFMNIYDPTTVFSSIDTQGRYSYGNQPSIAHWNLVRLAEALLPQIQEQQDIAVKLVTEELDKAGAIFEQNWNAMMQQKLGIITSQKDDATLVQELLQWMRESKADFTNTFIFLSKPDAQLGELYRTENFIHWYKKWQSRVFVNGELSAKSIELMRSANPFYIPRNHHVENALQKATFGNLEPLNDLLAVLQHPYNYDDAINHYNFGGVNDANYKTFCGT
jgi:serine/tyrosine/threonine adenylyltransferase